MKNKLVAKNQTFVNGLKNSLKQVELHQQGKIQLKDAYEFLKELEVSTM